MNSWVELLEEQKQNWSLAGQNYNGLKSVKEKLFQFEGFVMKVQFNPERIRSSAAKVDKQSIARRACFLCAENRPKEQNGILLENGFQILVNPFPIFKQHFTIVHQEHTNQQFDTYIPQFLELAKLMSGHSVFYNGPKCGASAPDHMHFQAGENGFMPVEEEFSALKTVSKKLLSGKVNVWAANNYLRKMVVIEEKEKNEVEKQIRKFFHQLKQLQPMEDEPLLNAIANYADGSYRVFLFPRKAHRPSQFFAEGEEQLLISPASVDFGGVFITPREEDFNKIKAEDIADIFRQVTLSDEEFEKAVSVF
ncbi:DUF4922 domain-containing protein [Prolixibacteraceae bacterium JC049]|nr:DUF4922 domain-containing protein [Prolixibacteraceae bacterium JC049]